MSRAAAASGKWRRLTAPGAAALSAWSLTATAPELCGLCGLAALPEAERPVRVRLPDGRGGLVDEGVLVIAAGAGGPGVEAELHLHGGHGVAAALTERFGALGWMPQVVLPEGVDPDRARLLAANSPLQARAAAALQGGAFERRLAQLAARPAHARAAGLAELAQWNAWAEVLEAPPRVVLAGPPNAGKSTLFNAWLREERVTVSPHPGTTRDAVSAGLLLGPPPAAFVCELVDTAGLWAARAALDRAAVAAAEEALAGAWRVVWVCDAAAPPGARVAAAMAGCAAPGPRLLHRVDTLPAGAAPWSPEEEFGGAWLRGSVLRDGDALLARLEADLCAALGPPPPAAALLPLGAARRAALRAALCSGPGGAAAGRE
ncbi:MAG TPA: GTPase [Planctomycetota bacterium]